MNTPHEIMPHGMYFKRKHCIIINHIINETFDQLIKKNSLKLMSQVIKCCEY